MEPQMIIDKNISYVEILEILKHMDSVYVDKIPEKIIQFFEDNKAKDYQFKYDTKLELDKQNLNDNTLALLAMLNLNYWCESEEHKKELISKYNENEKKYQEELRKTYNPDNLFKNRKQAVIQQSEPVQNEVALVPVKETIFTRFIKKIKDFFHIK